MEILGIDIGGTGIKGAIVDTELGIIKTERIRLDTPKPATPMAIIQTIEKIIELFEWKGKIGCGFPAAVKHEVVKTASNIDKKWLGMNAAEIITKKTGCPVHLINDVDAAGYAEMKFGAGKNNKGTVIVVAVGTGIGTSLFSEGILFPNSELGFVMLKGMPGEYYAANSVREEKDLSWKEWGKRLNEYLNRLESLFWPDLFIIGGGVIKKYDKYEKYLSTEAVIKPAELLNNAGIIGAALAARQQL